MPSAQRTGAAAWLVACFALAGPCTGSADGPDAPSRTIVQSTASAAAPVAATVSALGAPAAVLDAALTRDLGAPAAGPASVTGVPPAGLSSARCEWPDRAALEAIVPVATDAGSHASGVVFAHNQVLTAAHAVQGAGRFFVRTGTDFRQARLLVVDHEADLAILSTDTDGIAPLQLAPVDPGASEPVWAVGFPRAQALVTTPGVFQKNRQGALHTSAAIDSGQSGGGLLACANGRYRLAGMLRGYGAYLSGDRYVKLENHSVSVASTTIQRFLAAYR